MSNEKIESRRAFMKRLGKVAGAAVVAVPFMVLAPQKVEAQRYVQCTNCGKVCSYCDGACKDTCWGGCEGTSKSVF
ncbi:MAG: twin-arginine translocation signal domain-containing protein [Planctomycetia bacterium]|nr:twin-arginine translocation signal domain-containing protein [Planctomycetia bacterium]